MIPIPATAASTAASAVLAEKRERILNGLLPSLRQREAPRVAGLQGVEGDAVEAQKVGGALRFAAPGEIVWTAAHDPAHLSHPRGRHGAVGQRADPNRAIDVLVDETRVAVRQREPDVDLGKAREEIADDRQHIEPPEGDRRGDDEFAARREKFAGGGPFGLIHLFEDPFRGGEIGRPGVGQAELPRRPDEKADL